LRWDCQNQALLKRQNRAGFFGRRLPAERVRGAGFVRRETSMIKSPFGISVNARVVMMILDRFLTGEAFVDRLKPASRYMGPV
jgi:hypothetical protein